MATSAKQWKKNKGPQEITVPSGNVALVRRVDMSVFLEKGVLPNALKPAIEKIFKDAQAGKAAPSMEEAGIGLDDIDNLKQMVDAVVYRVVLEPKLALPPAEGEERDPEVFYVDEVDFEDRMFLFNWAVGGTADIKQFLNGSPENVGTVPTGEDVEHEAVTTP